MGEMKRSLVSTVGHARGEWASGRSASRQQALRGGEREEGGIQPDLGDLHRSIAKEIATLALALATTTTTTTTKEKPEYENMVKHYIVASVLLGSMLAGHAHAVTAPDAGLRKLQQDNYGDQYDPYGVDTDDDYYAGGDGYFYRDPAAAVGGVVDTVVDTAGNIVSNTATSAFETATLGLLGGK